MRIVTLPFLVRMVWVVIIFVFTHAKGERFAVEGHHKYESSPLRVTARQFF